MLQMMTDKIDSKNEIDFKGAFRVLTRILHDGEEFVIDHVIKPVELMEEAVAKAFVETMTAIGAIAPVDEPPSAPIQPVVAEPVQPASTEPDAPPADAAHVADTPADEAPTDGAPTQTARGKK
jgi:hypothetical protein